MEELDFFISYTNRDSDWAQWIAWELEKADYDCCIAAWDFPPGTDFMQKMDEALEGSKQVIAILSPFYFESQFGKSESNVALVCDPLGAERRLIPVRVRDCELKGWYRGRVYIDLVGRDEASARKELLSGIRWSRVGRAKPELAVSFPVKPQFPEKSLVAMSSVRAPSREKTDRLKILFLGATGGVQLQLERERDEISAAIRASIHADHIDLATKLEVTVDDFQEELKRHSPQILHFAGNMDGKNMILTAPQEGIRVVPALAMEGLIRTLNQNISLVILNACYSMIFAKALTDFVDCAIGIDGLISDEYAIQFSVALYRALGYGMSIQEAFNQAVDRLKAENLISSSDVLPSLVARKGVHPGEIIFLTP